MFWKLDIHTFLGTPRSAQSDFEKAFKYAFEVESGKRIGLLTLATNPAHPKPSFGRREWNEIEMNEKKKLEYPSLPLFGTFNGGNGKSIPLFKSLSGRE